MKILCDNIYNYSQKEYDLFYKRIRKDKKDKISKLVRKEDRYRSILSEVLLIKLLEELKINYNTISIYTNKYGKPYIKDLDLYFSISHSNEYVVCAISKNEIGIDIENIRYVEHNVIKQFATNDEQKYIYSVDSLRDRRSFEIFTLKEAYFKYLGTDLSNILQIEFTISKDSILCSELGYSFSILNYLEGYLIAVCMKES